MPPLFVQIVAQFDLRIGTENSPLLGDQHHLDGTFGKVEARVEIFADVSDALGDLQTDLRREVNPTVYSVSEFRKKISTRFICIKGANLIVKIPNDSYLAHLITLISGICS